MPMQSILVVLRFCFVCLCILIELFFFVLLVLKSLDLQDFVHDYGRSFLDGRICLVLLM